LLVNQRLLVGLVVVIALALRLYHLGDVPTVFFHDECDNTVNAIQILNGRGPGFFGFDWKPQPALAVHVLAGTLATFGASVRAVRLPSAILSSLAIIPFCMLARRAATPTSTVLAALLFATNVGYLHFSRTGWENAQICLWTLLAMLALRHAEERTSWSAWALAGFAAALATVTYFAGRTVIVFIVLYLPIALWRARNRSAIVVGAVIMGLTYAATIAPYVPTIVRNWEQFMLRTRTVFFLTEMPEHSGAADIAKQLLASTIYAAQTTVNGQVNNQPRYFPVDRPLFDPVVNALFFIGMVMSWRQRRETILWWLALLVPYVMTQVLTTPNRIPDLARGIGMLPITFLFVALGLDALVRVAGRFRSVVVTLLALIVIASASMSVHAYFTWASSEALARPLEPAIPDGDFPAWWKAQEEWVRTRGGFLNVDMFKELRDKK
jgi:4-amino-4-deoxy-L-arabinose transferase-like glycosyltransferase